MMNHWKKKLPILSDNRLDDVPISYIYKKKSTSHTTALEKPSIYFLPSNSGLRGGLEPGGGWRCHSLRGGVHLDTSPISNTERLTTTHIHI